MLFYFQLALLFLASVDAFESSINGTTFDSDYEGNERLLNEFAEFSNADGQQIRHLFAQRMLKFMNKSVDPCEDFYGYACGNYGEYVNNTSADSESSVAVLYSLRKLESLVKTEGADADLSDPIREFYDLCMNYKFTGPYKVDFFSDLLAELIKPNASLSHTLSELHDIEIDLFYEWSKEDQTFTVDSLLKENKTSEAERIQNKFDIDDEQFSQMVDVVKKFEEQLLAVIEEEDEVAHSIDELSTLFPNLGLNDRVEDGEESVKVAGSRLLKRLDELIGEADDKDRRSILLWHVLWKLSALEAQLLALETPDKIEKICVHYFAKYGTNETAYIFGRKYWDSAMKEDVSGMIERIRQEIKLLFEENEWLPPAVKEEFVQKVINILKVVGAPDFVLEKPQERKEWKYGPENFFGNVYSVRHQKVLADEAEVEDRIVKVWKGSEALESNGYYSDPIGVFQILFGMLVFPYYNIHFPNFYKYGKLGVTIGHELMHGFDNDGLKYDSEFEKRDWLPPRIQKKLIRDKECYYQQYQKHKTDGVLTMVENLPDNVGLEVSFLAYKKWAESEANMDQVEMDGFEDLEMDKYQAFFLSYAQSFCIINEDNSEPDTHAPSYIRVLGSASNSEDFAEAFNCPVGSKMNPKRKCSYLS